MALWGWDLLYRVSVCLAVCFPEHYSLFQTNLVGLRDGSSLLLTIRDSKFCCHTVPVVNLRLHKQHTLHLMVYNIVFNQVVVGEK